MYDQSIIDMASSSNYDSMSPLTMRQSNNYKECVDIMVDTTTVFYKTPSFVRKPKKLYETGVVAYDQILYSSLIIKQLCYFSNLKLRELFLSIITFQILTYKIDY